jgi:hypothetical protein
MVRKCDLTWVDSIVEFENVLQGQHRTAWNQTLHEHFPEPVNVTILAPAAQARTTGENFQKALQLSLQQTVKEKKPRDRQYIYLQPSGDYIF